MMRTALSDLVAAPLPSGFDPARTPVWLWTLDGARVLWASRAALVLSGAADLASLQGQVFGSTIPAVRRLSELSHLLTLAAPPRLERLRFFFNGRSELMTCLCKLVPLVGGGEALLVAAFGLRVTVPEAIDDGREDSPAETPAAIPAEETAQAPQTSAPPEAAPPEPAPVEPARSVPAVAPSVSAEPVHGLVAAAPAAAPRFGRRVTSATPPNWLESAVDERRPIRFTWSSDDQGGLTAISPQFSDITGLPSEALIGRSWAEIFAENGADGGEALAQFLSMTETWSAATVGWHVPEAQASLPVELSGVPTFDLTQRFSGFRGFGIFRLDRLTALPDPAPEAAASGVEAYPDAPQAPEAQPSEAEPVASHATDIAPAEALPQEHALAPEAPSPAEEEKPVDETPVDGHDVQHSAWHGYIADTPAPHHAAPHAPLSQDNEQGNAQDNASHGVLSGHDAQESGREGKVEDEQEGEDIVWRDPSSADLPAADRPAPAAASPPTPVTALSTTIGARLGEPKLVPLRAAPVSAPAENPALSNSERNAFREIAKALGARLPEDAAPRVDAPVEPPVALRPVAPQEPDLEPGSQPKPEEPKLEDPKLEDSAARSHPTLPPLTPAFGRPGGALPPPLPGHRPPPAVHAPPAANGDGQGSLQKLVEHMPLGVLVSRGDAVLYANRAMLGLTGYEDLAELQREQGLNRLFQGRAGDYLTGQAQQLGNASVMIGRRDGTSLPADVTMHSLDWEGAPASIMTFRRALEVENAPLAASFDVQLKARQQEAREARAILNTATDGVITLDGKGRILALNRSAEALFGYDQNEVAGERFTMLLSPESHPVAVDYLEGLKANGVASVLNDGREVMGRERKGGRLPLFMTIGRVSEEGEPKFAAVLRDITQWKRAEAELTDAKRLADRANAQKSDFLAKISHEIRTPLNAIIGFAEVMKQEQLGPIGNPRYKEYLEDIYVSGQHVMSLINDLLDLSKIEAGRMELAFTSVDLNAIVASCIAIMQPQANSERVIMRSHLAVRLPRVVADERSIRQIVLNLLSNATKFTDPGGQIMISTALTDRGEAVVRVRDTGIGMSEKDIEMALEPFRRVPTVHAKSGTGLGLPLTKALSEANRANLTIKSQPKEGTLVELTFPATRVLAE